MLKPLKWIAASALTLAVAGAAFAQNPIVIKFSHVVAPDTPKGQAADYFRKLVDERSHGTMKVEVYPNSVLYKDKEEMEALQLGAVQMLAPSLGKFGPLGVRQFDVFNLPFIFDDEAQAERVMNGPIGQGLLKKLEAKGLTGLAYWNNGFYVMTANKPLLHVADFKGMKMRIQSSKVSEAEIRALGGNPQVLAFSEVYQALQTGVVDGADYPTLSNLYTQKIYEVQKDITLSNHSYLGYGVIMNKKFWDGLKPEQQAIIRSAMKDATALNNKLAKQETEDMIRKIKATGKTTLHTLTPDEVKEWKKAMVPVHNQMAGRVGRDLIDAIYKETGFDPHAK